MGSISTMVAYWERLEPEMAAKSVGIPALAEAMGISFQAVAKVRDGGAFGAANNFKAAKLFGLNPEWLSSGKGPKYAADVPPKPGLKEIDLESNPEYPAIRRVRLKAQAGVSGFSVEYAAEDDGPPIVFRADWYKAKGYRPEKMLALRVKGDSMIPSMYEDDLIVINTMSTTPKDGIPFLVSYEGEIVVKRLARDDGMWWLTSDNPDQRRYARKICNGGTEIIGEVVYRQTERV